MVCFIFYRYRIPSTYVIIIKEIKKVRPYDL